MKRFLNWLDNHLLTVLAGFLLVFIPLYPKWPLFDVLPGYNVRVRLEDFLVAGTILIYLWHLFRHKIALPTTSWPARLLVAYLVVGFISALAAMFITQTVPLIPEHIEKTFLHWGRRIEYLSLFFVFLSAVKSLRVIKVYFGLLIFTLTSVIVYGFGQKYLYWPAFSTMNREFSKGWWLYLTEHARVLSTFGGHYDLAAYLVIALCLVWSFFFGIKKWRFKIFLVPLLASGFWLLILTASRSSFIGYLIGLSVVVFLWSFKKGLGWGIGRWLLVMFLSLFVMLSFGDLSDRYAHLLRVSDRTAGLKAILMQPFGSKPQTNAAFLENNLAAVTSLSDYPPLPKPADVGNVPPLLIEQKTATGSVMVVKPRTYSQNALLFDLSAGIRLDATWPRAIAGFKKDPILGSGYATLTKTSNDEFTEAESTDNDYLRSLGETGLLGFLTYFGAIGVLLYLAFKALGGLQDNFLYGLAAGFIGLTVGLLANATLLDIFEASKVSYAYWGVAGMTFGALYLYRDKIRSAWKPLGWHISWRQIGSGFLHFFVSDKFLVGIIIIGAFVVRLYKIDTPLADWHSWRQADTSAVTRNFSKSETINWLYPRYDDLSSVASGKPNPMGWRMVEFPFYNAISSYVNKLLPEYSVEVAGRLTTALFTLLATVFLFLIARKLFKRQTAYLVALTFAFLPYGIYYGRTILPDPTMVALALGALWFAFSNRWYLTVALGALALLVKPYAVFLLTPLIYIWIVDNGLKPNRLLRLALLMLLMAFPLLWWRRWITQFPEGIPASDWLYNGNGIRFKGAFWYWLFADRTGRLILGYWGLVPLAFGLVAKPEGKYRWFPLLFLLSSVAYLFVFATGNVQHDYYQILLWPAAAMFVGLGLDALLQINKILALVSAVFMLLFGWYHVRDYYNINHPEIVEAGKKLSDLTSLSHGGDPVIAPYDGDTAFLYQTGHRGWPIMEGTIEEMVKKGARYYVSVRLDDPTTKDVLKKATILGPYNLLYRTDKYVIVQLF